MLQLAWIALAWAAGIATILGSLMTLGSLLFWLVPVASPRSQRPESKQSQTSSGRAQRDDPAFQRGNRLKLLLVSGAIALAGISILVAVPTPFGH